MKKKCTKIRFFFVVIVYPQDYTIKDDIPSINIEYYYLYKICLCWLLRTLCNFGSISNFKKSFRRRHSSEVNFEPVNFCI